MTTQELDALQGLCEAATKEPWTVERLRRYEDHDEVYINLADDEMEIESRRVTGTSYENADFIAASRTALPELIAEARRLQRENAAALDNYNALSRDYHDCIAERGVLRERAEALENDLINASMNLGIMTERCEAAERDLAIGRDCLTCALFDECPDDCDRQGSKWQWRGPAPDDNA